MTPEEYERFKEAEKIHLRKLKEIKKVHAQMQRKSQVTRAVTDMASGIEDLFSEHEEMVYRLQADAAGSEARLDVALDSLDTNDSTLEALDAATLEADQELRRARAKELIRQMKGDVAGPDSGRTSTQASSSQSNESAGGATPKESSSSDLPEKTIGRMKP